MATTTAEATATRTRTAIDATDQLGLLGPRLSGRSHVTMSISKKLGPAAASPFTLLVSSPAFAQAAEAGANKFDAQAMAAAGAGLAIGLGVLGGALGQGRAAA